MVIKRKGKTKIVGLATTVIVVSMILGISMRIIKQQERNEIQRNYQGRLISELKDADMRIETILKEYDSKDLAYINIRTIRNRLRDYAYASNAYRLEECGI